MNLNRVTKIDEIGLKIDSFAARRETRVKLAVPLYLRRPNNNPTYRHKVSADEVSSQGAHVICDIPLEVGAILIVTGFNDRFTAMAVVRHAEPRWDGKWSLGLEFIKKTGSWIVK